MKFIVQISVFLATIFCCHCKVSFVKDQSMDIPFPPVIIKSDTGIPEGHLRPLGWQRRPDGKIAEEQTMLEPKDLYEKYVKEKKPVKFVGVLKGARVLESWEKDEKLKDRYGKLNVTVVVKKERLTKGGRVMKLSKFLLDYMYEDWYMSNTIPREMLKELPLPNCLGCGSFRDSLYEAELWMSSGGTSSLLHSHQDHNLHCVLFGRKDFILVDSKYQQNFDFRENYPNAGAGYSPIDMEMINVFKYKKIAKTPWRWSTLRQGDCILVPVGYLHQVRSFGRGISYTILFSPTPEFSNNNCNENKPTTLDKVDFVWTYTHGHRQLTNEKLDAGNMRKLLLKLMRDDDMLYLSQFVHFYDEVLLPIKDTLIYDKMFGEKAFEIMDYPDPKGYLTREEVTSLTVKQLDALADIFNQVHALAPHDEL